MKMKKSGATRTVLYDNGKDDKKKSWIDEDAT